MRLPACCYSKTHLVYFNFFSTAIRQNFTLPVLSQLGLNLFWNALWSPINFDYFQRHIPVSSSGKYYILQHHVTYMVDRKLRQTLAMVIPFKPSLSFNGIQKAHILHYI